MKFEHKYSGLKAEISDGPVRHLAIRGADGEVRMSAAYSTYSEAVSAMYGFCGWKIVNESERAIREPDLLSMHCRAVEAAQRFLSRNGCSVLEVDWGCPYGCCDIIAMDGDVLAFVEVKVNGEGGDGLPRKDARAAKRERMERIAIDYLGSHFLGEVVVRFDVVAVTEVGRDRCFIKQHIGAYSG